MVAPHVHADETGFQRMSAAPNGTKKFVGNLNKSKSVLHREPINMIGEQMLGPEHSMCSVEVAMQWSDLHAENVFCFTSTIRNKKGGARLAGFCTALTRMLSTYRQNEMQKQVGKMAIELDDVCEGLCAVVSIKMPDPKCSDQPKIKLVSADATPCISSVVADRLVAWLDENPTEAPLRPAGLKAAMALAMAMAASAACG